MSPGDQLLMMENPLSVLFDLSKSFDEEVEIQHVAPLLTIVTNSLNYHASLLNKLQVIIN